MHLYHFYRSHKLARLQLTDFWLYELSVWMHTFAFSLVNIFIPILLLKSGYPLQMVVGFYILLNAFNVPLNFVARVLVRKLGARFVIAAGTLAAILFFLVLNNVASIGLLQLVVLAFLAALYDALYWVAHFYFFTSTGGAAKQAGKSTSFMYAVREVALMIGPAVGAGILIFVNQGALLLTATAVLVISIVPLGRMENFPDSPAHPSLSFREFFKPLRAKRVFISTMLYAIHDSAESVLFPVFIYLFFGTLTSVAIIPIILSCTAVVVTLFLGRIHPDRRHVAMMLGAGLIAIFWLLRLSSTDPIIYYATILLVGLCVYFVIVPIDSVIFEYGKQVNDTLSASMYRNIAFMLTNVFLYGAFALLLNLFQYGFAIAAVSMVCLIVVNLIAMMFRSKHGI